MTFEDYEKLIDLVLDSASQEDGENDAIAILLLRIKDTWPDLEKQWDDKYERLNCHPE